MTRSPLLALLLLACASASACASQAPPPTAEPVPGSTSAPPPAALPAPASLPPPAPPPGAQPPGGQPQSFAAFVDVLKTAKYSDFAPPKSKLESEAAFEGMRGYLLSRYGNVKVPHSYLQSGVVYDCLPATGPATDTPCPAGHAPQRRLTLGDLTLYPNLAAFLGKPPGGGKISPPPPPY
jgi:hypothetical protein